MPRGESLESRFWQKVDRRGPDECWPWLAACREGGYGHIKVKGKMQSAHRVSWHIHNGLIPDGLCVLHHCDNPACVNPDHLFLGTVADNNRDRASKGRCYHGPRNWFRTFSEDQIRDIRSSPLSQEKLAEGYGVHLNAIWRILHRLTYVDVS